MCTKQPLKGHPKMKILLFPYPQAVPNHYEFLLNTHTKNIYFKEYAIATDFHSGQEEEEKKIL